jgi:hypothetical protein
MSGSREALDSSPADILKQAGEIEGVFHSSSRPSTHGTVPTSPLYEFAAPVRDETCRSLRCLRARSRLMRRHSVTCPDDLPGPTRLKLTI